MSYYGGDYYSGDYYSGDPGFFDFLKSAGRAVFGTVGGAVTGFLKGGPVGGIAGAVGGAAAATAANVKAATLASGGTGSAYTPELRAAHAAAVARGPRAALPVPAGVGGPGMALMAPGAPGALVRRMHFNRSTYVTRGGGTSRWPPGLAIHVKGTELVPARRMNVANPRALRRALRRVSGFAKIVKRARRVVSRAASAIGVRHGGRKAVARRRLA